MGKLIKTAGTNLSVIRLGFKDNYAWAYLDDDYPDNKSSGVFMYEVVRVLIPRLKKSLWSRRTAYTEKYAMMALRKLKNKIKAKDYSGGPGVIPEYTEIIKTMAATYDHQYISHRYN